jgi:hypothetical protein
VVAAHTPHLVALLIIAWIVSDQHEELSPSAEVSSFGRWLHDLKRF